MDEIYWPEDNGGHECRAVTPRASSIVNVMTISIEIGQMTTLSRVYTTQFVPISWTILPCILRATTAFALFLTRTRHVNALRSNGTASSLILIDTSNAISKQQKPQLQPLLPLARVPSKQDPGALRS